MIRTLILAAALLLASGSGAGAAPGPAQPKPARPPVELLNASYDVARELFADLNPAFAAHWKASTGQDVSIRQAHGGSSKQARAVADGLEADVVTFNQETDVDFLVKAGPVAKGWAGRLPDNASPYYSLPVFLVRKGNPKGVRDWDDLARPGVQPVFPNPKTSGNGRYTYLSAYAHGLERSGGDDAKARRFVGALLGNVPVFDTGGRGATTTFVEREVGDVLVTFESEVNAIQREYPQAGLQVVLPSSSLRADFPVAVVDKVADRHGTREVATAYLRFLYSEAGQDIIARHFNRVRDPKVAARYKAQFPEIRLVSVQDAFGGWDRATQVHFANGGVLDQLLAQRQDR